MWNFWSLRNIKNIYWTQFNLNNLHLLGKARNEKETNKWQWLKAIKTGWTGKGDEEILGIKAKLERKALWKFFEIPSGHVNVSNTKAMKKRLQVTIAGNAKTLGNK